MEKQQQPEDAQSISIKEYPPSEIYSSDPPPAYMKPTRASAVQIARIAAVTLVAVSFILGAFMLASAYVTATLSCDYQPYPQQEMVEDRPTFQHLVDPLEPEESKHEVKQQESAQNQEESEDPVRIKLPLQLDFDDIAGAMMEKNMRSRMNCVVEKRRAEEVMDHQPKTVRLPFGVNLTTDPRYEHVTGERMAIFCESGNEQRQMPREQEMTPIVVPIPVAHHLPPWAAASALPHPPQMMPPHHHQLAQPSAPHPHFQAPQMAPPHHYQQQIHPNQGPPPHFVVHTVPNHPRHHVPIRPNQIPNDDELQIVREVIPLLEEGDEARLQHVDLPLEAEGRAMHIPHPLERHLPMIQPQGRSLPVPSDTVKPPPPPFNINLQHPDPASLRPHFVQPRSVRSVDDALHRRDKRVRRCACDCAC